MNMVTLLLVYEIENLYLVLLYLSSAFGNVLIVLLQVVRSCHPRRVSMDAVQMGTRGGRRKAPRRASRRNCAWCVATEPPATIIMRSPVKDAKVTSYFTTQQAQLVLLLIKILTITNIKVYVRNCNKNPGYGEVDICFLCAL